MLPCRDSRLHHRTAHRPLIPVTMSTEVEADPGDTVKHDALANDDSSGSAQVAVEQTEASSSADTAEDSMLSGTFPSSSQTTTTTTTGAATAAAVTSSLEPIATPSISMSAGADPWADPPVFAPHASEMRKPSRDNPWATGSPAPELVDGVQAADMTSFHEPVHDDDGEAAKQKHYLVPDEHESGYDLPRLGKPAARYFSFKPGYLNLNSGAFGACPKPVMDAFKALEDRQEEMPDHFRDQVMADMLAENRQRVAKILHCRADDIAFIPNASVGTNSVLRDLTFNSGDAVLLLSSTYGAVEKTVEYIIESEQLRGVTLSSVKVPLLFPASKQEMLDTLRRSIDEAQKKGLQIRVGVIDTVASRPGVRLPWEEMVAILREKQILSMVDGAHGVGHVPINLHASDPDFFVSNCHKWLYAHRSCAVFYVPTRNRHLQRSSLPTSWNYAPNATPEKNSWQIQWEAPGTEDMAPRLSVQAALDFREKLGGEARIMNYCHDLAVRGGLAAARILGTSMMDLDDRSMTGCMANVRLPILNARIANGAKDGAAMQAWVNKASSWFFDSLLNEFKTIIPLYLHDDKIWARISAQIWLDIDDFEYGARALLELCKRINEGQAPDFNVGAPGLSKVVVDDPKA